jgi:NADH-quinone oxidoreductase subunit C
MTDVTDATDAPPTATDSPPTEIVAGVVHLTRENYVEAMQSYLDDGYEMCADLTCVDLLTHPGRGDADRFEIVVNLLSLSRRSRLRVRVPVPEADPTLPSLFPLWPGTEAMEREVWDMFGVAFTGHPDLTRILMPEDWEGHPLRKDYPMGRVPVQFKAPSK